MPLSERPKCPIHKQAMIPWQFTARNDSGDQSVLYGFKCPQPECKVLYSDKLHGFRTLTLDGTLVPYQEPA